MVSLTTRKSLYICECAMKARLQLEIHFLHLIAEMRHDSPIRILVISHEI